MSFLANLIGSGVPLIVAGAAWILIGHYRRLPGATHPWICRALIAVMFAAGSALAVSGLGRWLLGIITSIAGWFGGLGFGPAHVLIVLAAFSLLLTAIAGMIWAPDDSVATLALFLPLVLALPAGGFLHHVYVATSAPAQAAASSLSAWLAG